VLSGRGLCDELITRPEESYRLCGVVVCDLETSRMGAPYIYDISHLRVNWFLQLITSWLTSPISSVLYSRISESLRGIFVFQSKYLFYFESNGLHLSVFYCSHHMAFLFLLWRCDPMRAMASSFLRFLDHTQRRTTVGRTPLDEWSARRRDLYLTTHDTHNRQISMPPVRFKPTISADKRPETYALDCAGTGTGKRSNIPRWYYTSFYENA